MGILKLAAGVAVGYVLGSRAGREKYESIAASARKVGAHPRVMEAQEKAKALIGTGTDKMNAKLHAAAESTRPTPTSGVSPTSGASSTPTIPPTPTPASPTPTSTASRTSTASSTSRTEVTEPLTPAPRTGVTEPLTPATTAPKSRTNPTTEFGTSL
ncbi:MAG TPA: hypothetical protein VN408_10435 [Actinoplanes sp.]|nr:hypothetical protein [Actinoplanes sp.]